MDIRLDGKSAIITGGSKGLGLAIAKEYASSGADVAVFARDPSALADAKGEIQKVGGKGKVAAISCDVSQAAPIKAAYDQVMAEFGKVDILVNNAGQSQANPFLEVSDEAWQADFDLKVFAAIRLVRLCMPQMQDRKWGRIINVLNIGAKAPGPRSVPTSVSRAAGLAITKVLAHEGAPHNVLVNALHVGIIVSDQIVRRHKREGANVSLEAFIAKAGEAVPLGRMGKAEEFAAVATFLASEQAGYVTGTSINVDGGRSPIW
jgi:3-oxoacyl-[acyl-carrier protein] reductase